MKSRGVCKDSEGCPILFYGKSSIRLSDTPVTDDDKIGELEEFVWSMMNDHAAETKKTIREKVKDALGITNV